MLHIVNLKNSVKPGRKNLVKLLLLFDFFDLICNLQWCRIRRNFIFLISRHKVDLVIKTGGRSLARFFSFFLYQPLPIKWSWKHRTVSESARMCFKRKAVGNFVESGILYLNENMAPLIVFWFTRRILILQSWLKLWFQRQSPDLLEKLSMKWKISLLLWIWIKRVYFPRAVLK